MARDARQNIGVEGSGVGDAAGTLHALASCTVGEKQGTHAYVHAQAYTMAYIDTHTSPIRTLARTLAYYIY